MEEIQEEKSKQQVAIEKAYSCAEHWPFLSNLKLQPPSDSMTARLNRLANTGRPMSDMAAFQISDDDIKRLAATATAFFDRNHMSSWQRYRAEYCVNFRAKWVGIAGDDLHLLLTWLHPPNCEDVPYELALGLETAARLFINTQMNLMLDTFGNELQLAVVMQLVRGCHMAAWQAIKWELQRATARHRDCRCERCSHRGCYDPYDSSFADLSYIALGSSTRLEKGISRGPWATRFKAALGRVQR
uniref:Uncharacterized protein n=1 Tax=Tetradesmus obliquus TaxID=3088 RepID=A0A383VV20_TETOB|eukprot:jgi/Sobl393_1/6764/SZX68632.1